MGDIGSIEPEIDEEGDAMSPGQPGMPDNRKLVRAVRRLDHADTTPEQREMYIRWMRRATRAMLRDAGALPPAVPEFVAGDWLASTIGVRDGVPRSVAVCVLVHGSDVIGWETIGAGEDGAIEFTPIKRTSGVHWVKAASVNPEIIAAATSQGLTS